MRHAMKGRGNTVVGHMGSHMHGCIPVACLAQQLHGRRRVALLAERDGERRVGFAVRRLRRVVQRVDGVTGVEDLSWCG
jgi:hypothetical protein